MFGKRNRILSSIICRALFCTCVYKVYNQEKSGLDLDEIQSKADKRLQELDESFTRGNND